jgi:dTDP-4-dehydrorhamnose reductase
MGTGGTLAIVGAGGVLGSKLVEQARAASDEAIMAYTHGAPAASSLETTASANPCVTWEALDIGDAAAVADAFARTRPTVVVNAAAMTNVDACERERDAAWVANALGPRHLAAACLVHGARLLHVSTDYVFPGDEAHPGPYTEDAPVRAVNHYGWTKLMGERAVEEVCAGRVPWLVARTALVYGYVPGGRTNFVRWLAGELRAGRQVRIVDDQVNTPTLADDLAAALLHLMRRGTEGVIHVAGPDLVTRVEWARTIAQTAGLDAGLIDVVTTTELRQEASRPLRSGLRTQRSEELAGVEPRGVVPGLALAGLDITS